MKLTDFEINELIKIVENSDFYYGIGVGEVPNVCHDDTTSFWCERGEHVRIDAERGYFKKEKFSAETKSEIYNTLKDFSGTVFLFPDGTHCGTLIFLTGWVHQGASEEDLVEAVMPQRGL